VRHSLSPSATISTAIAKFTCTCSTNQWSFFNIQYITLQCICKSQMKLYPCRNPPVTFHIIFSPCALRSTRRRRQSNGPDQLSISQSSGPGPRRWRKRPCRGHDTPCSHSEKSHCCSFLITREPCVSVTTEPQVRGSGIFEVVFIF